MPGTNVIVPPAQTAPVFAGDTVGLSTVNVATVDVVVTPHELVALIQYWPAKPVVTGDMVSVGVVCPDQGGDTGGTAPLLLPLQYH